MGGEGEKGVENHTQDSGAILNCEGGLVKGDDGVGGEFTGIGGEEGDSGLRSRDCEALLVRPGCHPLSMKGEGVDGCGDVGGGEGVGEVVCVGSRELGGCGIGVDEEIEEDRGDAGALRDACVDVPIGGGGVVVSAAGHPPAQVDGQPANRVMLECCLREGGNEFSVVDHVKSFGKIN